VAGEAIASAVSGGCATGGDDEALSLGVSSDPSAAGVAPGSDGFDPMVTVVQADPWGGEAINVVESFGNFSDGRFSEEGAEEEAVIIKACCREEPGAFIFVV